jgi:hypothetical protein
MTTNANPDNEADDWYADVIATPGYQGGAEQPRSRLKLLADLLPELQAHLLSGEPPVEWTPEDEPWGTLAFGPKTVVALGAASSKGKTSLGLYLLCKMLVRYPDLRVVVASNDMDTEKMRDRVFSMCSRISYRAIRKRDRSAYAAEDVARAMGDIAQFSSRSAILPRPFTIEEVQAEAVEFNANIVFVDHLQVSSIATSSRDTQQQVAKIMRQIRAMADSGPCVITTAAISRQGIAHSRNRAGKRDVNDMDAGVFLHGSEIEYETDMAYLLLSEAGVQVATSPEDDGEPEPMWLHCVKGRDAMKVHVPLLFDGRTQSFSLREVDKLPQSKKGGARGRKTANADTRKGRSTGDQTIENGETEWLS